MDHGCEPLDENRTITTLKKSYFKKNRTFLTTFGIKTEMVPANTISTVS